jgi:hypothetical protein
MDVGGFFYSATHGFDSRFGSKLVPIQFFDLFFGVFSFWPSARFIVRWRLKAPSGGFTEFVQRRDEFTVGFLELEQDRQQR